MSVLPRRSRRFWLLIATIGGFISFSAAILAARIPFSAPTLRARIVATLSDALDADVELGEVRHRVWPMHSELDDLVIRRHRLGEQAPLIAVKHVTVDAGIMNLLRHRHVTRVTLTGLAITITPKPRDEKAVPSPGTASTSNEALDEPGDGPDLIHQVGRGVVVDEVVANDATLTILRRKADKPARVWLMHALTVNGVGARSQMAFRSQLTNAVPPGEIETNGSLGPWNKEDPERTPLDGTFTFADADLGYFKGIEGTLSAHGSYRGSLERIDVDGETTTPNFALDVGRHPMLLETKYHAIVDGTNGNTTLEQIDALLQKTRIHARGGVFETEGVHGRTVRLDVEIPNGRLEDVMRLAVNTPKPVMVGVLKMGSKLVIPPGNRDVVDKLMLDGAFSILRGGFTDPEVQQKVNDLSHRARGKDLHEPRAAARSDFSGWFNLRNGLLALHDLTFDTPGAIVTLDGTFGLEKEAIDFSGYLYMDAKTSETVSGWKSFVLKIIDPLFREGNKTVIPLKVHGTREKPEFGLDLKRVF